MPPEHGDAEGPASALHKLDILGTPAEERFDRITRLAAHVFGVKGAMINLIDIDRQWTKSSYGMAAGDVAISDSICRHVVEQNTPLQISDLSEDARSANNPFVLGEDGLRFYAGYPLQSEASRTPVGTLCVVDTRPRTLKPEEHGILRELAGWAEAELNNAAFTHLAKSLAERQQRVEALLRSMPEGVLIVNAAGTVEEANAASRRMFGGDAGEGQLLSARLPNLPPGLMQPMRRASDNQRRIAAAIETTAVRRDGSLFLAEVSISPLPVDGLSSCWVVIRDLGEIAAVEAKYRRQLRQTDLILSTLTEGILRFDAVCKIRYANAAAARLLNCRVADLIGKHACEALWPGRPNPDGYPCATADFAAVPGPLCSADQVVWRRDGQPAFVHLTRAPILEAGELQGGVISMVDASIGHAEKRREEEFVAVVSHELRTPLTSIKASLGLLKGQVIAELPAEVLDVVDIALSNTDRLARLVNDLLYIERLTAGAMPLDMADADLARLLAAVLSSTKPAADSADVRLRLEVRPGLQCEVDGDRISQAVSNLVSNAIKFSPRGGAVRMTARKHEDRVHILVQDWGRGIPTAKLERIFDRFGQAEVPGDIALGGTGLGLPIAKSIVEAHSGRLIVDSRLGHGSTFVIDLPKTQGHSQ